MIQPFQTIIDITENEQIAEEMAAYLEHMQHEMYQLMREIIRDDMRFVVELEKYRNRPLQGMLP